MPTFACRKPTPASPPPRRPLEFFAEIDERDLARNNRSTLYRQAYSYENDAQKNIFHLLDNSTFVAFDDYREVRLSANGAGSARAHTRPLPRV